MHLHAIFASQRWRAATALALCCGTLFGARSAWAMTFLIGVQSSQDFAAVNHIVQTLGGQVRSCGARAAVCVISLPDPNAAAALARRAEIRFVEPDAELPQQRPLPSAPPATGGVAPAPTANFPDAAGTAGCPNLWELTTIDAAGAWATVSGANAPVIAIADSGFLLTHQDLAGRVAGGYDYGDHDTVPEVKTKVDVPGHGTFIAGLIAGRGDNGVGRVGVAPQAQLFLQGVADSNGAIYLSYVVAAMLDLADHHPEVRVLSYSLTGSGSSALKSAVAGLRAADILLVAAVGNCESACLDGDNDLYPRYPGSYDSDNIVLVANSTRFDRLSDGSRMGATSVDIAAPGADLCSLSVTSDTATVVASGTSYAAPLVAAAAALVREAHPTLTAPEVAGLLRASAEPLTTLVGKIAGGRLDVARAVRTGLPTLQTPAQVELDRGQVVQSAFKVENKGGPGVASLFLFHPSIFAVSLGEGWVATPFASGDPLGLPTLEVAPASGTLCQTTLAAHSSTDLQVGWRSEVLGEAVGSARLILTTADGVAVPAPAAAVSTDTRFDPSGQPARQFVLRVNGQAPTCECPACPDPPACPECPVCEACPTCPNTAAPTTPATTPPRSSCHAASLAPSEAFWLMMMGIGAMRRWRWREREPRR